MWILLAFWKENTSRARRHSASFRTLLQSRRIQACRDEAGRVELVNDVFSRAFRLHGEVNHRAQTGIETVFATRRRLVDGDLGFRTKNSSDGQDLAFRGALKGQDISVFAFDFGEFVCRVRCVAGEETTGQNERVCSNNYKNDAAHNDTSV